MGEWTSLSVKESTRDKFNDAKQEMDDAQPNVPDLSADQFLQSLLDTLEHAQNGGYADSQPTEQVVIEEVTIQTEKSGVSAEEVDGMIEAWVERNYDDLRKGNL